MSAFSEADRDVERTRRAAVVVDDLASTSPWRPRGVEVRGRAEAIHEPSPLDPDPPRADRVLGNGKRIGAPVGRQQIDVTTHSRAEAGSPETGRPRWDPER
jgi:hypothetical protein